MDRVNRQFKAQRPNQLWVSDFMYVSTWQGWLLVVLLYLFDWRTNLNLAGQEELLDWLSVLRPDFRIRSKLRRWGNAIGRRAG